MVFASGSASLQKFESTASKSLRAAAYLCVQSGCQRLGTAVLHLAHCGPGNHSALLRVVALCHQYTGLHILFGLVLDTPVTASHCVSTSFEGLWQRHNVPSRGR